MHRRITPHPVASLAPSWVLLLSWVLPVIFFSLFHIFMWFSSRRIFSSLFRGGTLTADFQFVFNTVRDYSPHCWLALLTAVRVWVHVRVFLWVWVSGSYACVHVHARLHLCLLFVYVNMWEREKWLFLPAVLLSKHNSKVSFNTDNSSGWQSCFPCAV